jgi:hypothetical protein
VRLRGSSDVHFDYVHAAAETIGRIDDSAVVGEHVVYLHAASNPYFYSNHPHRTSTVTIRVWRYRTDYRMQLLAATLWGYAMHNCQGVFHMGCFARYTPPPQNLIRVGRISATAPNPLGLRRQRVLGTAHAKNQGQHANPAGLAKIEGVSTEGVFTR